VAKKKETDGLVRLGFEDLLNKCGLASKTMLAVDRLEPGPDPEPVY
jgi:hypothetical protein